jgi:hypothetical protein
MPILKKHRKSLRQTPFWVFSSGPVGDPKAMVEGVPERYGDRRDWGEIRAWRRRSRPDLALVRS